MTRTRWAATIVGLGALTLLIVVERGTLRDSLHVFGHLRWQWVPVAVLAEAVSMGAFALAQRHLVVVAGHDTPVGHALRTAYAGNAITGSVPFIGAQLGTLFTFRAYRRHGIDAPSVAWMLGITGVLSAVAYSLIAGTGAVVSGNPFATRAIAGSSVVLVAGAAVAWFALRRESWRPRLTQRAVRMVARHQAVTKSIGEPEEIVAGAFARFDELRPSRVEFVKVFWYEFVNCAADAACFAICIMALGVGVPWTRLVLVWVAGNTAKGVPVTPGGVGFVESALALALVGSGMHAATATAAALLYRLVSFWMLVAAGWLVVAIRRVTDSDGSLANTRPSAAAPLPSDSRR